MKKIIWVYGIIAGLIMGAMFFVTAPMWDNGTLNFDDGTWVGYTTMVVALSLIFFGVKSYRDTHCDGTITFGLAFKVGILIAIVASVLYALTWEIAYHTVYTEFTDKMSQYYLEELKNDTISDAERQEGEEEIKRTMVMYQNPFFRFVFSLVEVFPVALIIALISAGLLKKKEFLHRR